MTGSQGIVCLIWMCSKQNGIWDVLIEMFASSGAKAKLLYRPFLMLSSQIPTVHLYIWNIYGIVHLLSICPLPHTVIYEADGTGVNAVLFKVSESE